VGYEGDATALADYSAHMLAIRELSGVFPQVPVVPHAGELTAREADDDALREHVPAAVYVAGARRVGHGVAIRESADRAGLLRDMAAQGRTVEMCLTSNELLLGVAGEEHPLRLIWDAGVPVVLATDDAGIFRTDLTREFTLAATRYPWLGYADFLTLARRSIDVSFLPGAGLWQDRAMTRRVTGCAALDDPACSAFLGRNPRAAVAAELERRITRFEARVLSGEL
jgi:adenosine deaminase